MPSFKAAYLIHGDDHGRIAERRARLRGLAESLSGPEGVELLEGERATPSEAARALAVLTLTAGRRFIVVDGAERWTDRELDDLEAALRSVPPETTVAFFAREDSRNKAPERLHAAVRAAGGAVEAESSVKPWELPKWVTARAAELGLTLEPDAARALIRHVGERQQRLLRELEKLALGASEPGEPSDDAAPSGPLDAEAIEALTASSAESRAWAVADAIVAGDAGAAVRSYLALRAQGERLGGLIYWISQRVRLAHEVAVAVEAGNAPAQIKRGLRMPSRAADRLIADARRAGPERLRRATGEIADLELTSRGGGSGIAGEDTAALVTIAALTAQPEA